MIIRDGIGRAKLKFGAKFLGGKFEFTLVKVDETRVIVNVRKPGIELQGFLEVFGRLGQVALAAQGRSNKEIGSALGIEERTVKAHVAKLMRKVGVQNRIALSVHAITHSLVTAK
jgi:hypothetical protein